MAAFSSRIISALNALFFSGRLSQRVANPRVSFSSCMVVKSVIRAPLNCQQHASRSTISVACACALHAEYTEAGGFDWRVEACRDCQAQHVPGLRRINYAVIPQPCAGVVGVPLTFVLLENRLPDRCCFVVTENLAGAFA